MIHAICWTLIHSLWQGILAAALGGLVILATRKAPAIGRYRLLIAVLLLFVLGLGATFVYQLEQGDGARPGQQENLVFTTGVVTEGIAAGVPRESIIQPLVNYLNTHAFLIVDLWLICLAVQLMRLMGGLYQIRYIRRTGVEAPEWETRFAALAGRLGIRHPVGLLESAAIKIPSAVGFLKPAILVPLGFLTNLPADQVESILLHELAHIKRRDYLINLLLHITEAVFFFNPGLRWLNIQVRREREHCCDDIVLAQLEDRSIYFDALLAFKEYMVGKPAPAYAIGLGGKGGSLLRRILRMTKQENNTLDIMEKTILSLGLMAVITVGLMSMRPAQTQTPAKMPADAQTPTKAKTLAPRPTNTPPPTKAKMPTQTIVQDITIEEDETDTLIGPPPPMTVTPRSFKDTLPQSARRSDSLRKRKAERELAALNGSDPQAMKLHIEEQMRNSHAFQDAKRQGEIDQRLNETNALLAKIEASTDTAHQNLTSTSMSNGFITEESENEAKANHSNQVIRGIINELKAQGLIEDETKLSFSLDNDVLKVNNKVQPEALHQKLKDKYIHSPKDRFSYMRNGSSTMTSISVE